MEFKLEKSLEHQQIPVDKIANVFSNVNMSIPIDIWSNHVFSLDDENLSDNIQKEQAKINASERGFKINNPLTLDIKMETGTGKTYVYTKTMFELHKRFGINKFIIVVPSLSIKAGTLQFLKDNETKRHFFQTCDYRCEMNVCELNAPKNKKGKKFFPQAVYDFATGSRQNKNKIYVLVTNMQLCTGNSKVLKSDYDSCVNDYSRPFDAIAATRPFMIIDEPHRFDRNNTTYKLLISEINPQCVIRFGATFPDLSIGTGRNRKIIKDYENLLYNLNACEAFNRNLVKGVAKENFSAPSNRNEKLKILRINNKESVDFQLITKDEGRTKRKAFSLNKGDSLGIISDSLTGITIDGITSSSIELSNSISKSTGEEIDVDAYMTSYQEEMLKLALNRHFKVERENFGRHASRIKTLALFFIDDISSYRKDDSNGKTPYLKKMFEDLLEKAIDAQINDLNDSETEYKEFLLVSKKNISMCHAGYFSQDNNDSDESIAKEVDEILNGKKELLSFKDAENNWNVRRFLFSKWTLKEGWDNPNVFTITKLRSSGSEISKIQEVGRGLRLPVDEHGNRISNEDFTLNYIVDFTEADFAQKLIEEINRDVIGTAILDLEKIKEVAEIRQETKETLFAKLLKSQFVFLDYRVNNDKIDEFYAQYPEFNIGVNRNKILDRNRRQEKKVKIRQQDFDKLQNLWNKLNQRYMLYYDLDLNADVEKVTFDIFSNGKIFDDVYLESTREHTIKNGAFIALEQQNGVSYKMNRTIPYNRFLKNINKATSIPIKILHNALIKMTSSGVIINSDQINEISAINFINKFNEWKAENLQGHFHYMKENFIVKETILTDKDGKVKDNLVVGRIGQHIQKDKPIKKYLYDTIAYDSELELKNIRTDIDTVEVFGKIPTRSIKIPTIIGETYSPDFMYVVKHANGKDELNIVVESKDVKDNTELRNKENVKIECAKVFFEQLQKDGYNVKFEKQIKTNQIASIIEKLIKEN